MGIDTMTAGSTIAWAMEMTECGLLSQEEADGLDFTFGNADVLVPAIRKMGSREGIGKILSLGSRGAARALGRGEEYAMQVKGLDLAAYAARGFTGMGLSYATTGRGGDHNKAFTVAAEFLGVLGDYDRYTMEGKPELVKRMQDSTAIIDSLIMCMFTVDLGITVDLYARCANLPTGMNITGDDVYEIGRAHQYGGEALQHRGGVHARRRHAPSASSEGAGTIGPGWSHVSRRRCHGRVLRAETMGCQRRAHEGSSRAARHLT